MSSIWDFFVKDVVNEKATCKKCNKLLSYKNSSTKGLRDHLLYKHKQLHNQLTGQTTVVGDNVGEASSSVLTAPPAVINVQTFLKTNIFRKSLAWIVLSLNKRQNQVLLKSESFVLSCAKTSPLGLLKTPIFST